jgi:redox-regulated HSP33 family molecular chaperone
MKKEGEVKVKCEWCSKEYTIDEDDLDEIIKGKGNENAK